jgi:TonB family protein
MKRIVLLSSLILIGYSTLLGQELIEKEYCKNLVGDPAKSAEKAKFIKMAYKDTDGSIRVETMDIVSNKIVYSYSYKDKIPVGKWIMFNGTELDYNFEVLYKDTLYEVLYKDTLYKDVNTYDLLERKLAGDVKGNFEPPVFLGNNNDYLNYVKNNLQYPPIAAEMGIQGKVIAQFIINEKGKLCELSIYKSASKILDKEAARVIREATNWIPAKLDGKPISVAIMQPIVFLLQ